MRTVTVTLTQGEYWQEIIVVGAENYTGLSKMGPGPMAATLEREPDNRYDANAIKVFSGGKMLGYLSQHQARKYAPAFDATGQSRMNVEGICKSGQFSGDFNAFVYLPGKEAETRLAIWEQLDPAVREAKPTVDEQVSLYDKAKYQDAIAWCCQGLDDALVGAVLTSELMTTGKYKGQPRLVCTVADRVVGLVPAQTAKDHPEVFAAVESAGTLQCTVRARRFDTGFTAKVIVAV